MPKRELQISDAERKRRSDNAKKLTAEGRIGPQFGHLGGRPRKPRASELLADEARKDVDALLKVYKDGIRDDSMKTRLSTANSWVSLEQEERKLQLQEEKHELDLDKASREDLIGFLTNALTEGTLGEQVGAIFEGSAEDITDVEVVTGRSPEGDGDSS